MAKGYILAKCGARIFTGARTLWMRYGWLCPDRSGSGDIRMRPGLNARMNREEGEEAGPAQRGSRTTWTLGAAGTVGLVLLGLWTQRAPIAENFVGRELTRLGVRASYDLTSVGLRTHRIENIVLGNPAHPDLTAKWVEIDLTLTGMTPGVAAVRAGGVRLHGRLHDRTLSLGELDKFRDPSSTAPFSLPDLGLALEDARMRLDTDAGRVGLKLDGRGNLRDGFAGKLAAVMPRAALAGCGLSGATAYVALSMHGGSPRISGPLRAAALGCSASGIAIAHPVVDADLTLGPALDRWTGRAALTGEALRVPGAAFTLPSGHVIFDGNATRTRGQFDLASQALAGGQAGVAGAKASASWSLGSDAKGFAAQAEGTIDAQGLRYAGADPLGGWRGAAGGSPVGPLVARLADAVRDAGRDNRGGTHFAFAQHGDAGSLILTATRFDSRSGAHAALGEGGRFAMSWPRADWALDGSVTIEGGGLPKAALRLARRPGGGFGGQLFMDPYAQGDARIALEPVRFTADKSGATRFDTVLSLDGPLEGGGLKGLTLPIQGQLNADGSLAINRGCTPVSLTRLVYGGFALGHTKTKLCPEGGALLAYGPGGLSGGGRVDALRLEGRLGQSPMRLSADSLHFALGKPGFAARNADLSIGPLDSPVRLTAATLTGAMAGGGMAGTLGGATGRIGAVPLLVGDASGRWGFARGTLKVDGKLMLSDTAVPDRFNPLASRDFVLTMQDGRIAAKGTLVEPKSGATVALVDIIHDLGPGRGKAGLRVPGITFSSALQPEAITRLALGVVANAAGTMSGSGQIRWTGSDVTSDGIFRTDKMDLAAAFGPVAGLSGEIHFTDLVGLVTAPHQEVRLASVNPGIDVTDGVVRYQLIADQKVKIEGGEWPFSGGRLALLPTRLDFSADTDRYLTFRVIGLQAGAFINTLDLKNVSATGTFDGIMPLIFDATGGRIAGGVLVARQEGMAPLIMPEGVLPTIPCDPLRQSGTLSYVGPVSNEQVGVFGKIAFDALKNLQYKCLTILMDGALDGELVTNVVFNGVNRGKLSDAPESLARSFIGLPFIFNIRVEAPFRGLLGTAQSFIDPSGLVRNSLGDDYQQKLQQGLAVQPAASETVRPKDQP
ncbi:hypothetical protein BH10PSE12_BH10PSE12_25360 [soil metagenome]